MPPHRKRKRGNPDNNDYRITKIERTLALRKPEVKYHYTSVSDTVVNLSSLYYNLGNPAQGDGNDQRIGDTIRCQYLDIYLDVEAADIDCHIIRPIGGMSAAPAYSALTMSPGFFRPTEYKTYRRYFTTGDGPFTVRWKIPLHGLKISFQDDSTTNLNTILLYLRNVGSVSRGVRGTCVLAYTDL